MVVIGPTDPWVTLIAFAHTDSLMNPSSVLILSNSEKLKDQVVESHTQGQKENTLKRKRA